MKVILVLLVFSMLYGGNFPKTRLEARNTYFIIFAKEYYEAWAIGYCLGHYELDETRRGNTNEEDWLWYRQWHKYELTHKLTKKQLYSRSPSDIDRIVYVGGFEAVKELKDYIDKYKNNYEENKANRCLELLVRSNNLYEEIERIMKKYCKICK